MYIIGQLVLFRRIFFRISRGSRFITFAGNPLLISPELQIIMPGRLWLPILMREPSRAVDPTSNTVHRSLITNSGELSHSLHPFGINRPHDKLAPFVVAHPRDVHVLELHETGA